MPLQRTLIFDDECLACSALAQVIGARAPGMERISVYSPKALMLLHRHFPDGWAVRPYLIISDTQGERVLGGLALVWQVARLLGPAGLMKAAQAVARRSRRTQARGGWSAAPGEQMRAYVPASPADAAEFAGEPLLLPAAQAGLAFERVVQWYNLAGAFQTASYWTLGEAGTLVLEQVHRPSPAPQIDGRAGEPVALGNGHEARCYMAPEADAPDSPLPAVTLILPLPGTRWLALRATGLARESVIAIAAGCVAGLSR